MKRGALGMALSAGLLVTALGCSTAPDTEPAAGLSRVKESAGAVEITLTPTRLDNDGAAFVIVFDTHAGELDLDVAANATLTVNGIAWSDSTWSGAKPGGHHREGTLRFTAAGPATGTARLEIAGLEAPLTASWPL